MCLISCQCEVCGTASRIEEGMLDVSVPLLPAAPVKSRRRRLMLGARCFGSASDSDWGLDSSPEPSDSESDSVAPLTAKQKKRAVRAARCAARKAKSRRRRHRAQTNSTSPEVAPSAVPSPVPASTGAGEDAPYAISPKVLRRGKKAPLPSTLAGPYRCG